MTNKVIELDRIFHALSDHTRLAVVVRLSEGPAAVSELAAPFDMALPSFMQHLGVLQKCGLVSSTKKGRVRTFRLTPEPLKMAEHWLEARRNLWEKRLDQLVGYLSEMKEEQDGTTL